ncbi:hypothetical protein T4E_5987 [Trichinella pseudospiralis]|uniref:Uncharacterized protein n=1 Tax=Trichinella pseudospiralis TaxID=6337 RepID=A0A0V0Y9I9_TRIPS|nr:hypothetical protein T4E_5987 [Trichinella pseudospiralis]
MRNKREKCLMFQNDVQATSPKEQAAVLLLLLLLLVTLMLLLLLPMPVPVLLLCVGIIRQQGITEMTLGADEQPRAISRPNFYNLRPNNFSTPCMQLLATSMLSAYNNNNNNNNKTDDKA